MKKRFLSILLSLCMALAIFPATALAEGAMETPVCTCETACSADTMNTECPVCGAEGATVTDCGKYEAPAELTAAETVQALIDALPDADTITAENRADVEDQLTAIDDAKLPLTDEERDTLDFAKYDAAIAALNVLDGMGGAEVPTVLDGNVLMIGDLGFTSSGKQTETVGAGTATFDPSTSTLTLNNITLTFGYADAAAIESSVSNLKIELIGTNTINITEDEMAGIWQYGDGSLTIKGATGSELVINSTGKNNVGIATNEGVSLTLTDTNLTINDNTTTVSSKGYMVGLKPDGALTMSGGSYTATGVQSGIEMYTNYAANLSGVNFNITCSPRQSFDATSMNEMSIGLNLAPLTSKQNVIANCSGSISAHYPLYVDGSTALNNSSSLTFTTDNYSAVRVNADLTVSGGTLNLASTGSSGSGFYVLKSSKLAFKNSPNVTINVGYVAVYLSDDNASAEISSGTLKTTAKAGVLLSKSGNTFTLANGTLEMTPQTGATNAIGIQSYGTVSITGGSLKTSAGMYSAIQNAGSKSISFSGGTHTLSTSTSTGTVGYLDTAKGVLNISGTADVTFDGWSDGMDVLGTLNLSGGKLTARNAQDGIYAVGTLNLTGGTLNTSGTRLGVLTEDGGLVDFAGTDATLVGGTAGWGKTSGTGAYQIKGGTVVLQGGTYAAVTIYSSLAEGYHVYAGSSESNATLIGSPSGTTFTGNKYVRIETVASYTLTLVNVEGATSASHVAGADLSYTAADAPKGQHFAYWEMKVGDGEAVQVGTDLTYIGKMPTGDATLTAVYEYCSGGTATCQELAECDVCGKEYGILRLHSFTAEVVDEKYAITPTTCESEGTYYKSCPVCGASSENWNNATFSVPASHTESDWMNDADGHWKECTECSTTTTEKTAHTPNIAAPTETEAQVCTVCGYVIAPSLNHTHTLTKVEAEAPTCVDDGVKVHYECSGCSKLFADAAGSVEITADDVVDPATGQHNYEWVVDKEPTATEKGSKHEECTVCHDKKAAVEIPAVGDIGDIDELQALVNNGGTVTLQKNYNITSTLIISNTVTLDLNGYVIKMTAEGSVVKVESSGNLTLKDSSPTNVHSGEYDSLPAGGIITGATTGTSTGAAFLGGGVYVRGGTFTMNGGTITKCNTRGKDLVNYGGGVAVTLAGTFTMNGGAITDCDCKSGLGNGVSVAVGGTFTIAGSAVVNSNVYIHNNNSKIIANGGTLNATVELAGGTITRTAAGTSEDTYTTFNEEVYVYYNGTIEDVAKLTVTFDSNGGSQVEVGKALKGKTVGKPADPVREDGYTFLGWYDESGKEYDFGSALTGNMILKAKWVKTEVFTETDLLEALNAGATSVKLVSDLTLTSTLDLSQKDTTIDLNGHVLSGSTIKINTGLAKASLTLIDSNPTATHSDSSLPAGGVVTATISISQSGGSFHNCYLYANGGTVTSNISSNTQAAVIDCTNGTPTGFTGKVDGYYQLKGGIYYGSINTNKVNTEINKAVTFMNGDRYAVEYVAEGSKAATPIAPVPAEGTTFTGWYTDEDCTTEYTFGDVVSGDITLCAGFEPITYDVTYDPGAYGTGTIDQGTKTYGVDFTLSDETFTRDYYTQVGWATEEDGEKVYEIGDTYTENEAVTLYPVWEAIPYTFTVDISTIVKQGGNTAPGEATFTVEPLSDDLREKFENITITGGSVVTNGVNTYSSQLTITGSMNDLRACFAEGMYFHQKDDGLENWTYDDTVWALWLIENDVSILSDSLEDSTYAMVVYPANYELGEEGEHYYYTDMDNDPVEKMSYTNTYTETVYGHNGTQKLHKNSRGNESDDEAGEDQESSRISTSVGGEDEESSGSTVTSSPLTGDNSHPALWLALFAVSAAGVIGFCVYSKQKGRTE